MTSDWQIGEDEVESVTNICILFSAQNFNCMKGALNNYKPPRNPVSLELARYSKWGRHDMKIEKYNIRIDLRYALWEGVDWFHLAQNRD
jgi:hypothetical protein